MPVYIKKYSGDNYFRNRNIVDTLVLNSLPGDSFPRFRYETENNADVGTYRAGDFDLTISLYQREISGAGKNIKEFFLGTDRDVFYLVCVVIGNQNFSGTVQAGRITGALTYNKKEFSVTLIVKDILLEWAARCQIVPNSTINWGSSMLKTFEDYMPMHFGGLTSDVVLLGLPSVTYLSRLQAYGNPGECFAFKDFYSFITNQVNISRWETFKELAKGIGFNFEMYLNPGTEVLNSPEFIFNIFFVNDIASTDPLTLKITGHNEFTTEKRLEWLFLKYRFFTLSGVSYSQGILINSNTAYYTDTDQSDGVTLYPSILLTLEGKVITVTNSGGGGIKTVLKDFDCKEYELKNYPYSLSTGGGIGKLYPLTEPGVTDGGLAYSHIFHTTINPSRYDFNPIQRYAVTNYQRYLKGLQKAKSLVVKFNEDSGIKLWKKVVLNEGNGDETYYISAIRNIELDNKKIELELIKLSN